VGPVLALTSRPEQSLVPTDCQDEDWARTKLAVEKTPRQATIAKVVMVGRNAAGVVAIRRKQSQILGYGFMCTFLRSGSDGSIIGKHLDKSNEPPALGRLDVEAALRVCAITRFQALERHAMNAGVVTLSGAKGLRFFALLRMTPALIDQGCPK
jgi:hypothetical protein